MSVLLHLKSVPVLVFETSALAQAGNYLVSLIYCYFPLVLLLILLPCLLLPTLLIIGYLRKTYGYYWISNYCFLSNHPNSFQIGISW